MKNKIVEEIFNDVFSEKSSRKRLKKLGISEKELKIFMNSLLHRQKLNTYNRIFAEDEKRVLTPQAFGYLVSLLSLKSIDHQIFEEVINLSMQLNVFLKRKISKKMIDNIVNFLIFSDNVNVSIKELLDIFFINETEFDFDSEIN
ncbi:MAG: DUF494 family protein [Candidatus Cloacimonetes bacterium]|nr:DUF494 family protein [Candidatus Cloacimonadota bacterium]